MKVFFNLFLLFSVLNLAQASHSIVPPNDLWIGPHDKSVSGNITKSEFQLVLEKVHSYYEPIVFEKLNKKFKIGGVWINGKVNAYAQIKNGTFEVNVFGGLARHKRMNIDTLMVVVCHEIGHGLGGSPRKRSNGGKESWASVEGQTDYWSVLKCLKRITSKDDNITIVSSMNLPHAIISKCNEVFVHLEDSALCMRSAMAGLNLANFFRDLRGGRSPVISVNTHDPKVVNKTSNYFPKSQCRFDTYFAGALCDKDPFDNELCHRHEGYQAGSRPLCWFKPSQD